jgi:hypothetical protein
MVAPPSARPEPVVCPIATAAYAGMPRMCRRAHRARTASQCRTRADATARRPIGSQPSARPSSPTHFPSLSQ